MTKHLPSTGCFKLLLWMSMVVAAVDEPGGLVGTRGRRESCLHVAHLPEVELGPLELILAHHVGIRKHGILMHNNNDNNNGVSEL